MKAVLGWNPLVLEDDDSGLRRVMLSKAPLSKGGGDRVAKYQVVRLLFPEPKQGAPVYQLMPERSSHCPAKQRACLLVYWSSYHHLSRNAVTVTSFRLMLTHSPQYHRFQRSPLHVLT